MPNLIKGLFTTLLLIAIALQLPASIPLTHADETTPETPASTEDSNSNKGSAFPETLQVTKYLIAGDEHKIQQNLGQVFVDVINFLALSIGAFSFVAIVIGGFILVSSGGQEAMLQRGKDIIKFAIIGLVVALLAYYIVAFVQSIFYEIK
jgi:hypothetical protein